MHLVPISFSKTLRINLSFHILRPLNILKHFYTLKTCIDFNPIFHLIVYQRHKQLLLRTVISNHIPLVESYNCLPVNKANLSFSQQDT